MKHRDYSMRSLSQNHIYMLMDDLRKITLLPEKELIDFLESNTISIDGLKSFWLKFGRFPTKNEQVIVMHGLLHSIPYESNIGDLSKVSGGITMAKKPFPYVQVMFALFILFVLLHYAGCMSPVNNPGL